MVIDSGGEVGFFRGSDVWTMIHLPIRAAEHLILVVRIFHRRLGLPGFKLTKYDTSGANPMGK